MSTPSGIECANAIDVTSAFELLTPQEARVLRHLAEGSFNKEIAFQIGIKETTVKAHVSAVLRKLKCANRTQAAIFYRESQASQEH